MAETKNGQMTDAQLLEMAREIMAKNEEKARAREARKAEKAAAGPQPNAAHAFLHQVVKALTTGDQAFAGDPDGYRTYIRTVTSYILTAADMPNVTTARDFEVIGTLIKNTMPQLPVS